MILYLDPKFLCRNYIEAQVSAFLVHGPLSVTLNEDKFPKPQTPNPKPYTLNPKP